MLETMPPVMFKFRWDVTGNSEGGAMYSILKSDTAQ
jgi:hypothetical protein